MAKRIVRLSIVITTILLVISGFIIRQLPAASAASPTCNVTYGTNVWSNGFTANIIITNSSSATINGWTLGFTFPSDQHVIQGWSANWSQSGANVTATNLDWNASLAPNATASIGFNGSYVNNATSPTTFTVNGNICNQPTQPTPTPTTSPSTPTPTPGSTPTTTPTPGVPTPTPTPGMPGTHVDNPFAGAKWYVNPDWAAAVRAGATAKGGTLGQLEAKVANNSTAVWLDRIAAVSGGAGVTRTLAGHLDAALQQASGSSQPVVITIVVYDLPDRDCAALASNGELSIANNGLATYKSQYIDTIAATLSQAKYSNLRIAAIIEPDSLPNLITNLSFPKCAGANSSGAYVQGVQYALNKLHAISNVYNYLDVAHSGWLGWSSNFQPAITLISDTVKGTTAGVKSVDGFISNTANSTPTHEPFMTANQSIGGNPVRSANFYQWNQYIDEATYGTDVRSAFISAGFPASIGMLIDTSRNGWGGSGPQGSRPTGASTSTDLNTFVNASKIDRRVHRGNWCNQYGGLGERPQANPAPGFDAYVWIKPPGESDGASTAIPNNEGKGADPMCDPTFHGSNQANGGNLTEAIPNAPLAGHWFQNEFDILVQNAYPAIS